MLTDILWLLIISAFSVHLFASYYCLGYSCWSEGFQREDCCDEARPFLHRFTMIYMYIEIKSSKSVQLHVGSVWTWWQSKLLGFGQWLNSGMNSGNLYSSQTWICDLPEGFHSGTLLQEERSTDCDALTAGWRLVVLSRNWLRISTDELLHFEVSWSIWSWLLIQRFFRDLVSLCLTWVHMGNCR